MAPSPSIYIPDFDVFDAGGNGQMFGTNSTSKLWMKNTKTFTTEQHRKDQVILNEMKFRFNPFMPIVPKNALIIW